MSGKVLPPQPGKLLYENLFLGGDRTGTLELLSEGLDAFAQNANWLLEDAKILADAERYARAGFLVATAEEEIAKSYIMLDACRLDFHPHEGLLRRLCRAFYDHVPKYAYYQVIEPNFIRDPISRDVAQIGEFFRLNLERWRPADDIESGEPDMPHDTYFDREANLYVDFDDYSKTWRLSAPDAPGWAFDRTFGSDELSRARKVLDRLLYTRGEGFYRPEALEILNDIFKNHYIKEDTPNARLLGLYERLAGEMENTLGISHGKLKESALFEFPLYHFLQTAPAKSKLDE